MATCGYRVVLSRITAVCLLDPDHGGRHSIDPEQLREVRPRSDARAQDNDYYDMPAVEDDYADIRPHKPFFKRPKSPLK